MLFISYRNVTTRLHNDCRRFTTSLTTDIFADIDETFIARFFNRYFEIFKASIYINCRFCALRVNNIFHLIRNFSQIYTLYSNIYVYVLSVFSV